MPRPGDNHAPGRLCPERVRAFLSELTGWHPTLETIAGQAAMGAVYVLGAIWTFRVLPRRMAAIRAGSAGRIAG